MNKNEHRLANKIAARNACGVAVNELAPVLRAAVEPFLGQKLALQTGGRSAKFNKVIEALNLPCTPALHVWVTNSAYNLTASVRTSVTTPEGGTFYAEDVIYLGSLTGHDLTELYPAQPPRRTDFTAEEIKTARAAVSAARGALQIAERNLANFGEHDNH